MNNFREIRARLYRIQNGGGERKRHLQNYPCPSEVSSTNTLLGHDDTDVYSDLNCGEGEDSDFPSSEEKNIEIDPEEDEIYHFDDFDADSSIVPKDTDSTKISKGLQLQSEKPEYDLEAQNDSSVGTPQDVKNYNVVEHGATVQQSIHSSNENLDGVVISQYLTLPPLQSSGTINISQTISIPTSNWTYRTDSKNKPHDMVTQSENFRYHDNLSDSNQDTNQIAALKGNKKYSDYIGSEAAFKRKFDFGFEGFSFNPFSKPSLVVRPAEENISREVEKRFNAWLSSSPYAIWVTKVKCRSPFAMCKYNNCQHKFNLSENCTSSNIARHLKRQHNRDYELFSKYLSTKQPVLESFSYVDSNQPKPIPFTKKFLQFLSLNHSKLRILNMFIEGFIPFSAIEMEGMRDMFNLFNTAGLPII
ncbi:hypothetical protein KLU848_1629 [Kluyveromyces marxianus]